MTWRRLTLPGLLAIALLVGSGLGPARASDNPSADAKAAFDAGDYKTAAKILSRLASQGDQAAQYNLAMLYLEGKGVPKDNAKAASLFDDSARQGNPDAALDLGILLRNGQGLKQDLERAYMWLQVAIMQLTGQDRATASRYSKEIAKSLTSDQMKAAQEMIENCHDVGVEYCD